MKTKLTLVLSTLAILALTSCTGNATSSTASSSASASTSAQETSTASSEISSETISSEVSSKVPSSEESSESSDETTYYTIAISNGASSADIAGEAYNNIHVYRTDIDNDDDMITGTEVEEGANVSIFVYNLASDVELTITMEGEYGGTVTRQYEQMEAFVDDDRVEIFDLVITGDLTVTTKAIEEVTTIGTPKIVYEENENIQAIFLARQGFGDDAVFKGLTFGSYVPEGFDLLAGFFNYGDSEYEIQITIGGSAYEMPEIFPTVLTVFDPEDENSAYLPVFLSGAELTGDVEIKFVEHAAVTTYTVTFVGLVDGLDITMMYRDADKNVTAATDGIALGGYDLVASIMNTTSKTYRISVKVGETEIEQSMDLIGPADEFEIPGMGGFQVLAADLTDNVVVTFTEVEFVTLSIVDNDETLHVYSASDVYYDFKDGEQLTKGETYWAYPYSYSATKLTIAVEGSDPVSYDFESILDGEPEPVSFVANANVTLTLEIVE